MVLKKVFDNVFELNGRLFTQNLVLGKKVYGEKLVEINGIEFRQWDAFRSKLAGAIQNGLKEFPIKEGNKILYLGSSEGTTVSHLSDIIESNGIVFGVDVAERVMRKFIEICGDRENIIPILADANQPQNYAEYLNGIEIDLMYQDISQKNQAEIFNKNAKAYLKKGKFALIAIKARSISQEKNLQAIFEKELNELKEEFEILQTIKLEPFDKEHLMVFCRKK